MSQLTHRGIVLLGMPRSGTTLLRRLLDGHPNIAAPGETFLLRATARFLETERIAHGIDYGVLGGLGAAGYAEDEVLARLRQLAFGFLDEIAAREGKPRWAAKTAVDSFYLDRIDRIYGAHATFVCLVRHGLDVVCSLKEFSDELQGYIHELHGYVARYPRPLEAFAHAWADVTRGLLDFAERRPGNVLLCRYEDLVTEPEATLEQIVTYLGEPFEPGLVEAAFRKKDVKGLGDWKTYSKPAVERSSLARWKQLPGDALGPLAEIVNPVLEACGYEAVATAGATGDDADAMRRYELAMMLNAARSDPDES